MRLICARCAKLLGYGPEVLTIALAGDLTCESCRHVARQGHGIEAYPNEPLGRLAAIDTEKAQPFGVYVTADELRTHLRVLATEADIAAEGFASVVTPGGLPLTVFARDYRFMAGAVERGGRWYTARDCGRMHRTAPES